MIDYVYNALGQRVESYNQTDGIYHEIVYDARGGQLGRHTRAGWYERLLPLGGQLVAKYLNNVTYFLHPDHLGSTSLTTRWDGSVFNVLLYYPWGQFWTYSGSSPGDIRFAALDHREPYGDLYPTHFRMYGSRLYRWLSPDPMAGGVTNPQSLNRYAYVLNNPANFIDQRTGADLLRGCLITHRIAICRTNNP